MHARSVQTFHQCALRGKTPEDELLYVLDAISKACRNLKKELDETQLRELYLIKELQNIEENSGSNNVIPRLVDELQLLKNENERLLRENLIIETENIRNKKLVKRLQLSIDRLQSVIEHLSSENHQLKLKLKNGEIPKNSKSDPFDDECNCLNTELLFELETTTQKLKKSQSEIFRLNQEKILLKGKKERNRIDKKKLISSSDSASENTAKDDYIESMNLLHMKLKNQNVSDDSSSVSGFSLDSKDDVFSRLPSPIHKSVTSLSSGNDKDNVFSRLPSPIHKSVTSLSSVDDNTSSIDDGEMFTMERKMSLGGMIACNADKSLVHYRENTSTFNFTDADCEKTLSQSDLNPNSPRLVLGTSHILKNSLANVSRNLIDEEYFKTFSTSKSYHCNLPLLSDVNLRLQFNLEKNVSSDGYKKVIYEEFKIENPNQSLKNVLSNENKSDIGDEFKKLPNEIENPNRLHDTSPKAVNSSELNSTCSQKPEVHTRNIDWRNTSVSDRVVERVINKSGSGLTVNNHLTVGKLAVYKNKSLSQSDQHYANTIIDKYLRLLPLVPK